MITDDGPFFWHFSSFGDVLGDITRPINALDPEDAIGERVMLLLLGVAILLAAVFLLLPFAFVREVVGAAGRATRRSTSPAWAWASCCSRSP